MLLSSLPNEARAWLFAANRTLTNEEQTSVLAQAQAFLGEWTSHGRPVTGDAQFCLDCVLCLGAVVTEKEFNAGVSGCGIDSLTHAMEKIAIDVGFDWMDALEILYYNANEVPELVSRTDFRSLAGAGLITSETYVIDLTSTTVDALRKNGVKRLVADTWHAGLFPLAQTA